MPTKKTAAKRRSKRTPAAAKISPLVLNLRALLHTLRCIVQHEDSLCTLLHNLQSAPDSPELHHELLTLLEELPVRDYTDDLDALHQALRSLPTS